ncbi:hypothetical protein NFJ02_09g139290 [Pycnococcus provasolii]|mmetsp:Transcript_1263/g.3065  ORF Transcript_1263/g.3065 Transcript_1263/m.3065 type:complete len:525 (-) Transcript_1263:100-1674(-)
MAASSASVYMTRLGLPPHMFLNVLECMSTSNSLGSNVEARDAFFTHLISSRQRVWVHVPAEDRSYRGFVVKTNTKAKPMQVHVVYDREENATAADADAEVPPPVQHDMHHVYARAVRAFVESFVTTRVEDSARRTRAADAATILGTTAASASAAATVAAPALKSKGRFSGGAPSPRRMKLGGGTPVRKSAEDDTPYPAPEGPPPPPFPLGALPFHEPMLTSKIPGFEHTVQYLAPATPHVSQEQLDGATPLARLTQNATTLASRGIPEWQCHGRIPQNHLNMQETLASLGTYVEHSRGASPASAISCLSAALAGARCWVWWPDEDACYRGVVQGMTLRTKQLNAATVGRDELSIPWTLTLSFAQVSVLYDDPSDRGPYHDSAREVYVSSEALGSTLRAFKSNLQARIRTALDATAIATSALPKAGDGANVRPDTLVTAFDASEDAPVHVRVPQLCPTGGPAVQQAFRALQAASAAAAVKAETAERLAESAAEQAAAATAAASAAAQAAATAAAAGQAFLDVLGV